MIHGLTGVDASFTQVGTLHKGDKKGERGPGADLEYFRFEEKAEGVKAAFVEAYGARPTKINALLPFPTTDQNFQTVKEHHKAGGGLRHRCDGQFVLIQMGANGKYQIPEYGSVVCPGGCRPYGRLKMIIPALGRLGYVMLQTTSIHDIMEIDRNLRAIERLNGRLNGIPVIIERVMRSISAPGKGEERIRRQCSLVHVEVHPDFVKLQMQNMVQAALQPGASSLALPAWLGDHEIVDAEEDDDATESELIPTVSGLTPPVIDHKALEDEIKRFCMELFDRNKGAAKAFFDAEYGGLDYEARDNKFAQHQDKNWWIQAINDAMGEAAARGVSQDVIGKAVDENGGWGFDDLSLSYLRKICTAIGYTKEA